MKSNYVGIFLVVFVIVAAMSIGGSLTLFFSLAGLVFGPRLGIWKSCF